jgi:hypothetical protein
VQVNPGTNVWYRPREREGEQPAWVPGRVLRVIRAGNYRSIMYQVDVKRLIHQETVVLTKRMLQRARRDSKLWGAGLSRPPSTILERHLVSPETFEHLRSFIFSTDFLETLKASENNTTRGHLFAVREAAASTYPRYSEAAIAKEVRRLLVRTRADHSPPPTSSCRWTLCRSGYIDES